ncbi:hypothetical protein [Nocardia altamirensis]|uniref:hypothetical protein n=1 Tax=Nocardia altamirensis TaxID=472158 RepID=UPI00083FE121|nr:hypothetical protein [Nocardia altamirensis]
MSIGAISAAVAGTGWTVFWVQLPVLVLAVAVIIVATTALRRARPEDVPRVFEAFAAAFGRRAGRSNRARRPLNAPKRNLDEEAR